MLTSPIKTTHFPAILRNSLLVLCMIATPAAATGLRITVEGEANGVIQIDLFDEAAPKHAERIATLTSEGFYDGVYFHRVIDGFMAQTGDGQFARMEGGSRAKWGTGGSDRPNVPAEFSGIPFERGIVGMARAGDRQCAGVPNCQERRQFLDSANSQFFIMFAPGHFLNGKYTVVGKVTSGMEIVDAIKRGNSPSGTVSGTPDRMVKVEVVK